MMYRSKCVKGIEKIDVNEYELCLSHVGEFHAHSSPGQSGVYMALRFISSPTLTNSLLPLKFLRHVSSLSIFYRYFHPDCSSELACSPPLPPAA